LNYIKKMKTTTLFVIGMVFLSCSDDSTKKEMYDMKQTASYMRKLLIMYIEDKDLEAIKTYNNNDDNGFALSGYTYSEGEVSTILVYHGKDGDEDVDYGSLTEFVLDDMHNKIEDDMVAYYLHSAPNRATTIANEGFVNPENIFY